MQTQEKSRYRLYFIAILCTMLWGSAIPAIKLGYDLFNIGATATADKLVFAGVRFFGAGELIIIPLLFAKRRLPLTKKLCTNSLILGLVQTAGQYFFMYIGLAYTSGVNASIFNAIGTLLYVVLAWIIYRAGPLTKTKLFGCLIGFSGILLNSLASHSMGMMSFQGDGFVIIANICVAFGFLYSKHSVKSADPFLLTGLQMGIGGLVLLVIGIALGGGLPVITLGGVVLLLYLMGVSSVAFSLWTVLLRDYPPALVGVFNFLTPIFGALFSLALSSLALLNEISSFTIYTVVAIVCAAGGILLSSIGKRQA